MILKNKLAVRRFNDAGLIRFQEILKVRPTDIFVQLENLVNDKNFSDSMKVDLNWKAVSNRRDLAEVMWELFGENKPLASSAGDRQVWNWLAAALFETLHNGDVARAMKKKSEEIERWVLTESSRSYHRHLVSGPFFVFQNNWPDVDKAMAMLAEPTRPTKGVLPALIFSEVHERITGKRELSYGNLAHLATLLYVDPATNKIRDNLTDKPGEPQQLSTFCRQLDLTVDYESMDVKDLLNFLPSNFAALVARVKSENPEFA
jgi:hypothetical protein